MQTKAQPKETEGTKSDLIKPVSYNIKNSNGGAYWKDKDAVDALKGAGSLGMVSALWSDETNAGLFTANVGLSSD